MAEYITPELLTFFTDKASETVNGKVRGITIGVYTKLSNGSGGLPATIELINAAGTKIAERTVTLSTRSMNNTYFYDNPNEDGVYTVKVTAAEALDKGYLANTWEKEVTITHYCVGDISGIVDPTCTQPGYSGDLLCTICGKTTHGNTINQLGHAIGNVSAVNPTCTATGLSAGKKCIRSGCGFWEVPQEVVPALGHEYEEVVTTPPTCTEKGVKELTCTRCGEKRTEEVAATGHYPSQELSGYVAPTHKNPGYSGDVVCATCGHVITAGQEIAATGHTMGPWTSTGPESHTRVCSNGAECNVETEPHQFAAFRYDPNTTKFTELYDIHSDAVSDNSISCIMMVDGTDEEFIITFQQEALLKDVIDIINTEIAEVGTAEADDATGEIFVVVDGISETVAFSSGNDLIEFLGEIEATIEHDGRTVEVCSVCGEHKYTVVPQIIPPLLTTLRVNGIDATFDGTDDQGQRLYSVDVAVPHWQNDLMLSIEQVAQPTDAYIDAWCMNEEGRGWSTSTLSGDKNVSTANWPMNDLDNIGFKINVVTASAGTQTHIITVNKVRKETVMFTFNSTSTVGPGESSANIAVHCDGSLLEDVNIQMKNGDTWNNVGTMTHADNPQTINIQIPIAENTMDGPLNMVFRVTTTDGATVVQDEVTTTVTVGRDPTMVHFTEAQIQAMVTMIFRYVNARISERIVQQVVANDNARVVSGGALKTALDAADSKLEAHASSAKAYTDEQISALRAMVTSMNHWDVVSVTGELPAEPAEKTIYLQRDSEDDQTWVMTIATKNSEGELEWIVVGDTTIDLQNYWAKDNVDGLTAALFANDAFKADLDSAVKLYTDATFIKTADHKTVLTLALADPDIQSEIFNGLSAKVVKLDDVSDANSVYDLIKSKLYEKGNAADMLSLVDALSVASVEVRTRLLEQLAADKIFGEDTSAGFDSRYWKRTDIADIRDAMVDTRYFFNMTDKASWFAFFDAIVSDTYGDTQLGLHTNEALLDHATPAMKKLGAMLWPEMRAAAGMPTVGDDGSEITCTPDNLAQAIRSIANSGNHWTKSDEDVAELRSRLNIPEAVVMTPVSNETIISIVNNAFADTKVNLEPQSVS